MAFMKITEITRRSITKLFKEGYIDDFSYLMDFTSCSIEDYRIFYKYYGELTELDFLKKIYQLDKMPSTDPRYPNAEGEIWQHTINNDDYEFGWFFTDDRFELYNGRDEILLKFLCTVFHPAYRDENGNWKKYLEKIQELLHVDGYELYVSRFISGKEVYEWRKLTETEINSKIFVPFSQRYKDMNISTPKINIRKRGLLNELMARIEKMEHFNINGYNYQLPTCKAVIRDIKKFYTPKAYNNNNIYTHEEDFEQLIMKSSPKTVFDIIELYAKYNTADFENEINFILKELSYKLVDGKMMMKTKMEVIAVETQEPDLRELITIAENYFRDDDTRSKQIALEKIWDALEKLKTYYLADKKKSLQMILKKISKEDAEMTDIFDNEFNYLTKFGNAHQIRHFETDKIPIKDIRMKEYWYMRCLALINLAIRCIEE